MSENDFIIEEASQGIIGSVIQMLGPFKQMKESENIKLSNENKVNK